MPEAAAIRTHTPSLAPDSYGLRSPGWLAIHLRQVTVWKHKL